MDTPSTVSHNASTSGANWNYFIHAAKFWEPRRLFYNLLLSLVVIIWIVATWPHFRPAFALFPLLQLTVLALFANVCYSTAYLAEFSLLLPPFQAHLLRWRWGIWTFGTLLALLFENYWIADEIYPFVH